MVKIFNAMVVGQLEVDINSFFKKNPNLEIVSVSHANVVKHGIMSMFEWNAIVVYKEKT